MSDRSFADDDFRKPTVELTGAESHHLTHVLRQRVGDLVTLFNGRGFEATGEICEIGKRRTVVCVAAVRELPPDAGPDVTLAVAVPKGERFRWLVEKAAELGVRRVIPLQTERSAVAPGEGKLQKARRAVIEAAKQCGASRLMEIGGVTGWESLLDRRKEEGRDLLVAHPGGVPLAEAFALADSDAPLFAIGPEGGFTGDEISAARSAGALLVDLGPQHLRVETAAVAVAAYARLAGSPG